MSIRKTPDEVKLQSGVKKPTNQLKNFSFSTAHKYIDIVIASIFLMMQWSEELGVHYNN